MLVHMYVFETVVDLFYSSDIKLWYISALWCIGFVAECPSSKDLTLRSPLGSFLWMKLDSWTRHPGGAPWLTASHKHPCAPLPSPSFSDVVRQSSLRHPTSQSGPHHRGSRRLCQIKSDIPSRWSMYQLDFFKSTWRCMIMGNSLVFAGHLVRETKKKELTG